MRESLSTSTTTTQGNLLNRTSAPPRSPRRSRPVSHNRVRHGHQGLSPNPHKARPLPERVVPNPNMLLSPRRSRGSTERLNPPSTSSWSAPVVHATIHEIPGFANHNVYARDTERSLQHCATSPPQKEERGPNFMYRSGNCSPTPLNCILLLKLRRLTPSAGTGRAI